MTTRSQERKTVAEVSGAFEAPSVENKQPGNLIAGPSKPPKIQPENLEERKTSLR